MHTHNLFSSQDINQKRRKLFHLSDKHEIQNQLPLRLKYISENSKVDFEYDYLFMKALNKTLYR